MSPKPDNVNDHRAATSDSPFQNARTSPLRVHRIVIPRLPRVNCRYLNPHCIVLPCRKPARFVVNRESGVVHHAAIVDVVSMEWSAASMSRTRTSTSRTKASAWRTCRERQRSCRGLRLKRYNVRVIRAANPVCRRMTERGKILNPEYSVDRDQPTSRASPLRINTLLCCVFQNQCDTASEYAGVLSIPF